jgi:hypothetical protein
VAESKVDIGRRGVENGLMPPVDGLSVALGELTECLVDVTARAASIAFASARRRRPTGNVLGMGWRARSAAASDQRPRRVSASAAQGVEVATEALVEAGDLSFRYGVEGGVDRGLVVPGVDECEAQVDRRQGTSLGADSGGNRLPTQLDRLVGVTQVAAGDAQDTACPHPGLRVVIGSRDEAEDLLAPTFGCRKVARQQRCLPEASEHRSRLGAFSARQQLCRQRELDTALL